MQAQAEQEQVAKSYIGYDGDTIEKVFFHLPSINVAEGADRGEIYPDLFAHDDGLWRLENSRLAGIDCAGRICC